jgi:two-component system response regulator PrrA
LSANPTDPSSPLILVVDDDDPTRDALVESLKACGYRCVGLGEGATVLDILKTGETPAAIVVDLYMPGMDGFEVMSALKAAASEAPVIVISGGMPGRANALLPLALDFGAAAVLRKPFAIAELDAAIRKAIGKPEG